MDGPLAILHMVEKNRLHSGSVVQMLEAAAGLAARGHRVVVASRADGDLEDGCAAAGVAFRPLALRHPFDLASAARLRRQLRASPTHVIHVHKGRAHAVALLAAAGLGRLPVVVVNRGVSFPLDRFNRIKYCHPRVAAVVCVAEAVREVVIGSGGLAPEKVVTVHSATDLQRFDPDRVDGAAVRAELGLDAGDLLVGQVSVRPWKGWRHLLAAAAELLPQQPGLRLLLVGCEPAEPRRQVLREAAAAGLGDALLTLPYRRDMPEVLAACDVVVDASTEGTGITGTIREAMALGRAVVASDCAGNPELVHHDVNGLLFAAGDPQALAAAIGRLLARPGLRARLGAAAWRTVTERFSLEGKLDRLEALYRRIAASSGTHAPDP